MHRFSNINCYLILPNDSYATTRILSLDYHIPLILEIIVTNKQVNQQISILLFNVKNESLQRGLTYTFGARDHRAS
jgi:hypothetical protein